MTITPPSGAAGLRWHRGLNCIAHELHLIATAGLAAMPCITLAARLRMPIDDLGGSSGIPARLAPLRVARLVSACKCP
jgi:hypothetical protein